MNQFILTGFVTDNRGLQTSQRGTKYIRFQVTYSKPLRDGQSREESWWATAFGKTAEDAAQILAVVGRNAQVYVCGTLSRGKRTDQNGAEFWDTDLSANFVLPIPQQPMQQYQAYPQPPMPLYQQSIVTVREATPDMMPEYQPNQSLPSKNAQNTFQASAPTNYTPNAQNAKFAPQNTPNSGNAAGNAVAAAGDDVPF